MKFNKKRCISGFSKFLFSIILLINIVNVKAQVPKEERDALIELYNVIEEMSLGAGSSRIKNYLYPQLDGILIENLTLSKPIARIEDPFYGRRWTINDTNNSVFWHGVRVENDRVVGLYIKCKGLNAPIPASIKNLKYLEHLVIELDNNSPSEIEFTQEIFDIQKLELLYINSNAFARNTFKKTDLTDLSKLVNLKVLLLHEVLADEQQIPASLWDLKSLQVIQLSTFRVEDEFNSFIFSNFENIAKLTELKSLFIEDSNIEYLPVNINELSKLESINLRFNRLLKQNNLPNLGDITSLKRICIFFSPLLEEIPDSFGSLINLEELKFAHTGVKYQIPRSLSNLNELRKLELPVNNLEGEVSFLFRLPKLSYLDLKGNKFEEEFTTNFDYTNNTISYIDLSFNPNLKGIFDFGKYMPELNTILSNSMGLSGSSSEFGFNNLNNLNNLQIQDNFFVFDNFNEQLLSINKFVYNNQKLLPATPNQTVAENSPVTLQANSRLQHPNNGYQWQKKEGSGYVTINTPAAKQKDYIINSVNASDAGEYQLIITNPTYPALTLTQEASELIVNSGGSTTDCDQLDDSVDGSFEVLQSKFINGETLLGGNVTGAGFFKGRKTADSFFNTNESTRIIKNHPASPNGGVFAGVHGYFTNDETFYSIISIKAGQKYKIRFWQAYGGNDSGIGPISAISPEFTSHFIVSLNGQFKNAPEVTFTGFGTQQWSRAVLEFTATETIDNARLEFDVFDSDTICHYLTIDGIEVIESNTDCDDEAETPTTETECPPYIYQTLADLPVPNGGSTVEWFSFDINDDLSNPDNPFSYPEHLTDSQIIDLAEADVLDFTNPTTRNLFILPLDYSVRPLEQYWGAVDDNYDNLINYVLPKDDREGLPDLPQEISFFDEEFESVADFEPSYNQSFLKRDNPTVSNLKSNSPNTTWHASMDAASALGATTPLIDGSTYYAAIDGGACRREVVVSIGIPEVILNRYQSFCASADKRLKDIAIVKKDPQSNLVWYNTPEEGVALDENTVLEDDKVYYVAQSDNSSESVERALVVVDLIDPPSFEETTGTQTIYLDYLGQIPTVEFLKAPGSYLNWYTLDSNGDLILLETFDEIATGKTYFAKQRLSNESECESGSTYALTVEILDPLPDKIVVCEKFRPNPGDKYVFSAWVKENAFEKNNPNTINLVGSNEGELFINFLNDLLEEYVLNNAEPTSKFVPLVHTPRPIENERKYDVLKNYLDDKTQDSFTIYNFKYLTQFVFGYKQTIGFQFSFSKTGSADFVYKTPVYKDGYRYPILNNQTLELNFSSLSFSNNELIAHADFILGENKEINTENTSEPIINFNHEREVFTTKLDADYQAETYASSVIELIYTDKLGNQLVNNGSLTLSTTGPVIDGWQRVYKSFRIPLDAYNLKIILKNNTLDDVNTYFDDIRMHPFDSNLKSFVYDPVTQRLEAELDENNYATFYEYDKEGGLIRVKKETKRGVYTIQETRSATKINTDN